ncbi:hypothetical protein ILUMI_15950 [Ignelater luminosus]|uniref:Uncharacterized protein n=1 Tax=Ignelater luminosus TaxID=2038154 RepID=A0A8K0CT63_IGNLU|nr:hypothetical protein ILUMI_15950 [Ignelater luminosus]
MNDFGTASTSAINALSNEPTEMEVSKEDSTIRTANYSSDTINDGFASSVVRQRPVPVPQNFNFLVNSDGRKFLDHYCKRQLPNGEKVKRDWLIYSMSKDSIYCFCCKIFSKTTSSLSDLNSFLDWQHLSLTLERHETSVVHNENVKS